MRAIMEVIAGLAQHWVRTSLPMKSVTPVRMTFIFASLQVDYCFSVRCESEGSVKALDCVRRLKIRASVVDISVLKEFGLCTK